MDYKLILRNKVIVIGDAAVGKSSLCKIFAFNASEFSKNYTMTVGCEVCTKLVDLPETKSAVELFLFDTSGQHIFKDMFNTIWEGASSMMLVYDATQEESFKNCRTWLDMVNKGRPDKKLPGVLVANKIDLEDRIVVHAGQGASFAEANNLVFFQCSAGSNKDVDAPFMHLATAFRKQYEEKVSEIEMAL